MWRQNKTTFTTTLSYPTICVLFVDFPKKPNYLKIRTFKSCSGFQKGILEKLNVFINNIVTFLFFMGLRLKLLQPIFILLSFLKCLFLTARTLKFAHSCELSLKQFYQISSM